ncbi:hypothetical protein [Kitasatospora sp. NPDC091276]|uniref:hypothetical protein n=1 Tax=Kitasatospora sp. NPDC091276 TaxID=3155300 RepID=UPI0034495FF9
MAPVQLVLQLLAGVVADPTGSQADQLAHAVRNAVSVISVISDTPAAANAVGTARELRTFRARLPCPSRTAAGRARSTARGPAPSKAAKQCGPATAVTGPHRAAYTIPTVRYGSASRTTPRPALTFGEGRLSASCDDPRAEGARGRVLFSPAAGPPPPSGPRRPPCRPALAGRTRDPQGEGAPGYRQGAPVQATRAAPDLHVNTLLTPSLKSSDPTHF